MEQKNLDILSRNLFYIVKELQVNGLLLAHLTSSGTLSLEECTAIKVRRHLDTGPTFIRFSLVLLLLTQWAADIEAADTHKKPPRERVSRRT